MIYKWIGAILLLSLSLVGCSSNSQEANSLKVEEMLAQKVDEGDVANQKKSTSINLEELKSFFEGYFKLSQEQRLILNQNPIGLNQGQQKLYKQQVILLEETLGEYLSEESKKKLTEGYLGNEFHAPKILEMNNYITIGESDVEEVAIQSVRTLGEHLIYEVDVTTREKVISSVEANKIYVWDNDMSYYRLRHEGEEANHPFESLAYLEEELSKSYLFLQETPDELVDEIRLVHSYWIEVEVGEKLKIVGIEEADPFTVEGNYRQKASSHKYVNRVPYAEEVSQVLKARVEKVMRTLLTQSKDFFEAYNKIVYTSYENVQEMFQKIGLQEEIIVPKVSYRNAYSPNLNPYKDDIKRITLKEQAIQIIPSIFSTQKQPRYQVVVPFEGLCKDNRIVYYKNEYLVGLEQEKIEFIHFVSSKQIPLEQYEDLSIE